MLDQEAAPPGHHRRLVGEERNQRASVDPEVGRAAGELYDLDADPFELTNLYAAPEYQNVGRTLAGQLAAMRGCALGSCQQIEEE